MKESNLRHLQQLLKIGLISPEEAEQMSVGMQHEVPEFNKNDSTEMLSDDMLEENPLPDHMKYNLLKKKLQGL